MIAQRIQTAQLLWISRQRRKRWIFTALYEAQLIGVKRMNKPVLPHEESRTVTLNFDCPPGEMSLIHEIAKRGYEMAKEYGVEIDRMLAAMDVAAVHCNGTPLELWQFLASDASDFSDDFTKIGRWIDRKTGKLGGGVTLKFAKKKN